MYQEASTGSLPGPHAMMLWFLDLASFLKPLGEPPNREARGGEGEGGRLTLEKLACRGPTTSSSSFIVSSTDNNVYAGFPSLVRLMRKQRGGLSEFPRDLSFVHICTPIHAPPPSGSQWELDTIDICSYHRSSPQNHHPSRATQPNSP